MSKPVNKQDTLFLTVEKTPERPGRPSKKRSLQETVEVSVDAFEKARGVGLPKLAISIEQAKVKPETLMPTVQHKESQEARLSEPKKNVIQLMPQRGGRTWRLDEEAKDVFTGRKLSEIFGRCDQYKVPKVVARFIVSGEGGYRELVCAASAAVHVLDLAKVSDRAGVKQKKLFPHKVKTSYGFENMESLDFFYAEPSANRYNRVGNLEDFTSGPLRTFLRALISCDVEKDEFGLDYKSMVYLVALFTGGIVVKRSQRIADTFADMLDNEGYQDGLSESLIEATHLRAYNFARALLSLGAFPSDVPPFNPRSALETAVEEENTKMVKVFIQALRSGTSYIDSESLDKLSEREMSKEVSDLIEQGKNWAKK